jgi:hypothetical protein
MEIKVHKPSALPLQTKTELLQAANEGNHVKTEICKKIWHTELYFIHDNKKLG